VERVQASQKIKDFEWLTPIKGIIDVQRVSPTVANAAASPKSEVVQSVAKMLIGLQGAHVFYVSIFALTSEKEAESGSISAILPSQSLFSATDFPRLP
jgi:hypothetical protein